MRILGIDYGDARTGIAITDPLNITAQGLETIHNNGSDKIILKRLDEILEQYPDYKDLFHKPDFLLLRVKKWKFREYPKVCVNLQTDVR